MRPVSRHPHRAIWSTTVVASLDRRSPRDSTASAAASEIPPTGSEFLRAAVRPAAPLRFQSGRYCCGYSYGESDIQPQRKQQIPFRRQSITVVDSTVMPNHACSISRGSKRTIHHVHEIAILGSQDVADHSATLGKAFERMQLDE